MKGDVFKKIGAAVTMVTMMASVGFTAFATEIKDGDAVDFDSTGRVTATVNVEKTDKAGIFAVNVDYTTNVANSIGVTMLAYADTADGQFESTDIPAGYTETGMQIVGIKQNDGESAVDGTGSFEFLVNTNEDSTGSGMIRMDVGDVGIVLVSSDGAVAPTGYLFTIPDGSFTVEEVKAFDGAGEEVTAITVANGTEEAAVLDELNALTVKIYGAEDQEETWTAEWAIADYDAATAGEYTATATLTRPAGCEGILGAEDTLTVTVNVEELEWEATAGSMADVRVTVDQGAEAEVILAAVKAELMNGEKVVSIADADEATDYTATVAMTEAIANTAEFVSGDASPYTYKVTVADDALVEGESPADSIVTIVTGGFDVEFTVNVSYNATGEFDAIAIKAVDESGAEVTAIEVEEDTTEEAVIDALEAKVVKAVAIGDGDVTEDWVVTGWTIAGYDAATAGDYTATAELQAPDNAKANLGDLTLTVTVTVVESGYLVGDVTGDGNILPKDWMLIIDYLNGAYEFESDAAEEAADVTGDGNILPKDWMLIIDYLNGDTDNGVGR